MTDNCSICSRPIEGDIFPANGRISFPLDCGHELHIDCILSHIYRSANFKRCPNCGSPISNAVFFILGRRITFTHDLEGMALRVRHQFISGLRIRDVAQRVVESWPERASPLNIEQFLPTQDDMVSRSGTENWVRILFRYLGSMIFDRAQEINQLGAEVDAFAGLLRFKCEAEQTNSNCYEDSRTSDITSLVALNDEAMNVGNTFFETMEAAIMIVELVRFQRSLFSGFQELNERFSGLVFAVHEERMRHLNEILDTCARWLAARMETNEPEPAGGQ